MNFDSDKVIDSVLEIATTWGLRVLGALAVLVLGVVAARWVRRGLRRGLTRARVSETLVPFLSDLAYYAALAFVVVSVLGLFGIPTASLVAVLGAAGLAVGLALQGTLSNFAAGVMLLAFRPFRVSDLVEIGGTMGVVDAITVFTTTLHTPDNVQIVVPNAKVWGEVIKNYTANETRRIDLVIGISYDDDIGLALDTIRSVVEADGRVLAEPALVLAVGDLGDSSVNLLVRPWCQVKDYWAVRWDLIRAIKVALEGAGCSIPYPQRDVHLYKTDA